MVFRHRKRSDGLRGHAGRDRRAPHGPLAGCSMRVSRASWAEAMTPERRQQVERIYQAALDRDPTARSTFLDDVCAGDAQLRAQVESLLSAAVPAPRATAGQRLGPYELVALIGAGGMGEVWRALDPGLRRHVAIKILPPQYSQDPDRLRRFEHEAQAAGVLNHPNVLSVYGIGRHGDTPYLVTELLDGATLRQRLADGALPERKALEFADQLIQGLAAAHDKGIVHRDLKPENVFITRDERVKILDFGLAKLAPSGPDYAAQTRTATGMVVGTPAYMSPEQVHGQRPDHRADIFAVGVLLYEMLAGRRPFLGDTNVETMTAILKQDPPAIPGVSPQVEQIVRHCLEKEPAARYQSARDLAFQLHVVRHPSTPTPAPVSIAQRRNVAAALVGLTFLAVAVAALTWWLTRPAPSTPAPSFRQLTFDSGLTTDPALSPDGHLIAYASDRSGAGNLDIWRQQLATGEAIPLTNDPADESEPAFSPDGSRIAFRSERDGGGVYVVSAFGGEPRLIARQGRGPRFSPDGSEIAFWFPVGPPYIGRVFVVPAIGGSPIPIAPTFASAMYPVWSGDGRNLLFLGISNVQDAASDAVDWWVVPRNGSPAIKTGASDVLKRQRITETTQGLPWYKPRPSEWVGNDVFFSGSSGESANLWRISVPAATGVAEGAAERLTSGTSVESKPSVISRGRIAFASLKQDLNIWSLSVAGNVGRTTGDVQQVTGSAFDAHTSLSADGKKLAFISNRSGHVNVWMKNLVSGRETALTATPAHKEQAEITADGTRVAYLVAENSRLAIHEVATSGGMPQKICDDCGRPWDWSPDGRKLLYAIPEGSRQPGMVLGLLNTTTREKTVYLEHPDYTLARARFSPDGRWVSFGAVSTAGVNRVIIAPFPGNGAPPEDKWITIAEETKAGLDKPRWSPDGNLLYYVSEADGFRCIRARRLDPATKRPSGRPFDVYHSHSARRSLMNAWFAWLEISVSSDKLFFNLGETTGNIWMAEWKSGS